MEICIHSLEKGNCFYCNGTFYIKKVRTNELKENYELAKAKFRNFKEIWTEEEILVVYESFNNCGKKDFIKTVFKTAMQLERTTNAIKWMWFHLFSDRTDLHRGNEVIKFREIFNLIGVKE